MAAIEMGKSKQQLEERDPIVPDLPTLLDSAPGTLILIANEGVVRYESQGVTRVLGHEPGELVGTSMDRWIHPDDVARLRARRHAQPPNPASSVPTELRFRHRDGSWRVLESFARALDDEAGLVLIAHDVTERKRTEALWSEQLRLLELMASPSPLSAVLAATAGFVEAHAPHAHCCILTAGGEDRLHPVAAPSLPPSFVNALDTLRCGPSSWSCGIAFDAGRAVVTKEIDSDPQWSDRAKRIFHDAGLRAAWSMPLSSGDERPLGVIALYVDVSREPSEKEEEILRIGSYLATVALERKRAGDTLSLTRFAMDHAADPAFCLGSDGGLLYLNEAACRALGYSREELLRLSMSDIDTEFSWQTWKNRLRADNGEAGGAKIESTHRAKDGRLIPVEMTVNQIQFDQEDYCYVVARDVSNRKEAEERLRESEERYALAARGANDGLWDWNLKSNEIYLSPRWKSMLGWEENEVGKDPEEWFRRVHPDDLDHVRKQLDAHLAGVTPHFESEHRMRRKDGTYCWTLSRGVAVRDAERRPTRIAGSQTDITERKVAEERLLHDALHDTLTGLPNRARFMDVLRRLLTRSRRRRDLVFAVLFLDFDRFKIINDSLGHMVGDQLLVAIGERLKACVRPGDTVARLGGDEFTLLLHDIKDVTDATRVAERIHQELRAPFKLNGMEVFTTASIGIAMSSSAYEGPEEVLRDADIAMYRAKAHGRARHEVFDESMHEKAMALLELETHLRKAVEASDFRLHYQPIVCLESRRIVGLEALTRWQHPTRGLVPPSEFLAVAEETGLIVPIGWWCLREACRQMREWHVRFSTNTPLTISVNLSAKQFSQADLVEQTERILRETRLPPEALVLEITESGIMENAESAVATLSQLRSLRVHIHMDDFGTGYSSLGYLHRFQIDTLKIDRSFVANMSARGQNWITVRTILNLAENLGMKVIAEGVETEEQLAQLKELNCGYAQGDLFSQPLDGEAAEAFIIRHRT